MTSYSSPFLVDKFQLLEKADKDKALELLKKLAAQVYVIKRFLYSMDYL